MIDKDTMKSLQTLSRLKLGAEEEENLSAQLEQILEYFQLLSGYETVDTDVQAALSPEDLREDEKAESFGREEIESFTVELQDGHLVVPRILDRK